MKNNTHKKSGAFRQLIMKNGLTLLSLVVVLGMLVAVQTMQKGGVLPDIENPEITGGEFNLTASNGKPFTQENFKNHYTLLYFGYTFCPDICPTALNNITEAYQQLTPAQQKIVQVVFVSVDPARDTLESLQEYMEAFNPNYIGVTGKREEIDKAVKAYKAEYVIMPPTNKEDPMGYFVNHTGWVYLIGYNGEFIKRYSHNLEPAKLLKDLQQLLVK